MIGRTTIVAAAALALASCATPYTNLGVLGGVKGQRIDEHRAIVSMKGNLMTNAQTAHAYVLRKASEITLSSGFKTFKITAIEGGQKTEMFFPTFSRANVSGGHASGFSMTSAFAGSYPDMTVTIWMSNEAVPADPDSHTYDAADVLKYAAGSPAAQ